MKIHILGVILLAIAYGQTYVLQPNGGTTCPSGYDIITDESRCRAAADSGFSSAIGAYRRISTSAGQPRGCYNYNVAGGSDFGVWLGLPSDGVSVGCDQCRMICQQSGSPTPTTGYKVVVLGDIHGDYDMLIQVLRNNGMVDSRGNWIASSNDRVISVGDMVGRGHQDRQVLEYIQRMDQSPTWVQILGNHGIMQVRNDLRYAQDGSGIGFGSTSNRQAALRAGTTLGNWLRSLGAIHKQGNALFIHGGLWTERNLRSISDLNTEIRRFVNGSSSTRRVYDDLIWDRNLIRGAAAGTSEACNWIRDIHAHFGTTTLFLGHTTTSSLGFSSNPTSLCGGRIWAIDTRMSRWMSSSSPRNVVLTMSSTGAIQSVDVVRTSLSKDLAIDPKDILDEAGDDEDAWFYKIR